MYATAKNICDLKIAPNTIALIIIITGGDKRRSASPPPAAAADHLTLIIVLVVDSGALRKDAPFIVCVCPSGEGEGEGVSVFTQRLLTDSVCVYVCLVS